MRLTPVPSRAGDAQERDAVADHVHRQRDRHVHLGPVADPEVALRDLPDLVTAADDDPAARAALGLAGLDEVAALRRRGAEAQDGVGVAGQVHRDGDRCDHLGAVEHPDVGAGALGVDIGVGDARGEQERTRGEGTDVQSLTNPSLHGKKMPFRIVREW
nr:hypothetical protein GCM10020092_001880 [Actinoplanes digitatis]